jgi:hypothetical protein
MRWTSERALAALADTADLERDRDAARRPPPSLDRMARLMSRLGQPQRSRVTGSTSAPGSRRCLASGDVVHLRTRLAAYEAWPCSAPIRP